MEKELYWLIDMNGIPFWFPVKSKEDIKKAGLKLLSDTQRR